jgi:tRNA nucleotidyltransferase (CCA-adding enzyme)
MLIFDDFEAHLMTDDKPSNYLNVLSKTRIFEVEYPFTLLGDLMRIDQSPEHHPEGSVWNHTMLVLDNAAKRKHLSKNPRVFMWAALLHDLGKATTTRLRKGRITSYDHDKAGEKLSTAFLKEFVSDDKFIYDVSKMVRWHMQILFVIKGLPFADIKKMAAEVSLEEIALLGFCDRLGRGKMTNEKRHEELRNAQAFLEKCAKFLNDRDFVYIETKENKIGGFDFR